ncbi:MULTISPECIES: hypothetical protein [unclassified Mesorhizobium]|uniref:hypothetical protein n=1 Tax=unclassified Mesorhizobium TaxID=325217 RepID=UPI000FE6E8E4|nr:MULTISPECIES: hypothetical protein [unclassified Mesorhizobium]TGT61302.1 hypothetical protein EN813_020455 [Mesorhizobium sp. M00.F.Ca.ET.170.01.1.1]RWB74384.1 MAG: hypothetical protein EOQ49_08135 [Mesorhizobium sp.]RWB88273.1 MAG: hypothetical protein EOQ52_13930 [Mesorhizobium sp.]RWE27689.1 MAG: hypothetical protein EOS41_01590 [Mesorhizobium sp.]RWE32629.1 MAG: hypothetical protein EOS77_14065 [Mesorhizobium sp.]
MSYFKISRLSKHLWAVARGVLASVSLSGFVATAHSDTLRFKDTAALRLEVISRLRSDSRVKEAIPDPVDLARLSVTTVRPGKDQKLEVDVTNLLGRLRELPANEVETEIHRFLNVLVLTDTESGFDADHLIANIRPREHLDAFKDDVAPGKGTTYEDLAGDVVILYQIDAEESLASVPFSDVGGRSLPQLRQLALENIDKQMPQVRQEKIRDGISLFTVEGDEAISPALLLTDKFWALLEPQFPDGVLIAIPRRDSIFVFDKRLPNSVQLARTLITRVFRDEPDLLSENIFERRDGKLQVVAEQ